MTNEEIFAEIFAEATGLPKQLMRERLALTREMIPNVKWDEEITGPELEHLLKGLKAEAPAIRNWLLEGAERFEARLNGGIEN